MYLQVNVPDDVSKRLGLLKINKNFKNKSEVVIFILERFFNVEDERGYE